MPDTRLQEVDARLVAALHDDAQRLAADARCRFDGNWRRGLDPRARAAATITATRISTQLMEAMSWLLTVQAVAAGENPDAGPMPWRARSRAHAADDPNADLAEAVERLYRRIVDIDAELR